MIQCGHCGVIDSGQRRSFPTTSDANQASSLPYAWPGVITARYARHTGLSNRYQGIPRLSLSLSSPGKGPHFPLVNKNRSVNNIDIYAKCHCRGTSNRLCLSLCHNPLSIIKIGETSRLLLLFILIFITITIMAANSKCPVAKSIPKITQFRLKNPSKTALSWCGL